MPQGVRGNSHIDHIELFKVWRLRDEINKVLGVFDPPAKDRGIPDENDRFPGRVDRPSGCPEAVLVGCDKRFLVCYVRYQRITCQGVKGIVLRGSEPLRIDRAIEIDIAGRERAPPAKEPFQDRKTYQDRQAGCQKREQSLFADMDSRPPGKPKKPQRNRKENEIRPP